MYGDFVLLDEAGKLEKGERVYVGDVKGKNERWLRDILFANPELIPVKDIDSTFGPLVPLCKELRTDAGQIDAVFVNPQGRLTLIECKLWKNPEARREVVAQTLDYMSVLSAWSYDDLKLKVSAAVGRQGNTPFELVRKQAARGGLREREFNEAVGRSLREGRVLVLVAGDDIRERVQTITQHINNTKAFTFGLVEVAIYKFGKNRFAIQPRVLAKTEVIERHMTIVNMKGGADAVVTENISEAVKTADGNKNSASKLHLKPWWHPVLNMKFDDPEQEAPFWVVTNNVVLNTPFAGIQIKAWAAPGVFLSGPRLANLAVIEKYIKRERSTLLKELPNGTEVDIKNYYPIYLRGPELKSDNAKRAWIIRTLNTFANVLRPRLRKWHEEVRD